MVPRDERRLGWGLVAVAGALVLGARFLSPVGAPPLYDGVPINEPYVWLQPPPGYPGGAEGAEETLEAGPNGTDLLAVATAELSPQAQVIGVPGSLVLRPDATTVRVSITPVPAPAVPPADYIDGNVYRFELTDQNGNAVAADPGGSVTIVLRAADPELAAATIERFDGQRWQPLKTDAANLATFVAIITQFGDYAVVGSGLSPYPSSTQHPPTAPIASGAMSAPPARSAAPASVGPGNSGSGAAGDAAPVVFVAAAAIAVLLAGAWVMARRRTPGGARPGWGP